MFHPDLSCWPSCSTLKLFKLQYSLHDLYNFGASSEIAVYENSRNQESFSMKKRFESLRFYNDSILKLICVFLQKFSANITKLHDESFDKIFPFTNELKK